MEWYSHVVPGVNDRRPPESASVGESRETSGSPRLTLRAERAAVTRRRIESAARVLFARDGYGATTLKQIAAEAGVAVQTVYAVYRSKLGILDALREEAVNQPEANSLFRQAMSDPSPVRAVELFARSIRARWESAGDIVAIHRDAATADRLVREGMEEAEGARRSGIAAFARWLEPALREGLTPGQATAILDGMTLPALYVELTEVHGWGSDEYQEWLTRILLRDLLDEPELPRTSPPRK